MDLIRAFIGVNLSVSVIRDVAEVGGLAHRRCASEGWKISWIAPPHLQVMLRYLGSIGLALPSALKDHLAPLAATVPPFPLLARGIRVLESSPEKEALPLLVVPIDDETGQLQALRNSLATPLADVGLPTAPEPWPDTSLVIGRIHEAGTAPLEEILSEWRHADFGRSLAREMVLYRSDGAVAGKEYSRLWHLSLSGSAPLPRPDQHEEPASQAHVHEDRATEDQDNPIDGPRQSDGDRDGLE